MAKFSRYQKFVVALLAFLQFTIILDFMIISPLGAILMPALKISPVQFGAVVSAYAFSAGISGLLAGGFADRYDRKKLLLFFYVGFVAGTLFCGLANSYMWLLIARMVTGLFGGVIGSITLAITTDLFPLSMRGRVMGVIQTSFAASQVLGIPAGLFFSNLWGWHAPFIMIVIVSTLVGFVIWRYLKPIDEHLKLQKKQNAFVHLRDTVFNPDYALAFIATALVSIGGFMLMPFGSAFIVNNLKVSMDHLPMIYLITGIFAIFIGPLIGKMSDSFGSLKVFMFGGVSSIIMIYIYTNLAPTDLWIIILVNVVLFVAIFSRIIPSQALTSQIPEPANRGSFMAVSSSLQQIAGGVASILAGWIVVEQADGSLAHFDRLGYVICASVIITMHVIYFINQAVNRKKAA